MGIQLVVNVFMSHTKLDKRFCDRFDNAVARVGISAFRSEFETIEPPAWKTIKEQMELSSAMFLLVGRQLVKSQAASDKSPKSREEWKHTQNWIAYEVGLACEKGIDVWVLCEYRNVRINFPVPYFNNYALGLGGRKLAFIREVLENYSMEKNYPLGRWDRNISCPYRDCEAEFNLHTAIKKGGKLICPTCLKVMVFSGGFSPLKYETE